MNPLLQAPIATPVARCSPIAHGHAVRRACAGRFKDSYARLDLTHPRYGGDLEPMNNLG
jgi:hypothetical protein